MKSAPAKAAKKKPAAKSTAAAKRPTTAPGTALKAAHIIVDGSNIAWEATRTKPLSYTRLRAAVDAFTAWLGATTSTVTIIVDTNFPWIVAPADRKTLEADIAARTVLVAPANSMDTADGLILALAVRERQQVPVFILSNDSYRNFDTGEHPRLAAAFTDSRTRNGSGVQAFGVTADRNGYLFSQRSLGNPDKRT